MKDQLIIVEGVESVFSYHIGKKDFPFISLCGRKTMETRIPLSQYNSAPGHLHEKWCKECWSQYAG